MDKRFIRKFTSLLITVSLLLSVLPGTLPVMAVDSVTASVEQPDLHVAQNDSLAEDKEIVLSADSVPEIVGYEKALQEKHILRLYDEEGDDLNKVVFLNKDGTRTLYLYDHPVKYLDSSGAVRDVSLDIASEASGFRTAAGNAVTTFSAKLSDGISLSGNGVNVEMVPVMSKTVPQTGKVTADATVQPVTQHIAQRIDSKTIQYPYDSKTTIEYSLTYTGFKEDIVVSEYTGQTEYPFLLYTNGCALTEIDGSYYLTDDEGNIKATIGDIIIFTADERNNTFGQIVPTTIVENEQYLLTIVVDADYLADEKTVYPIRIDPTVEINYASNSSGIQDVTVSAATTYSGSHGSLYMGDKQGVGLCRALMKFPGLDFLNSSITVQSATLLMRDLMCEGQMLDIYCHVFNGNEWSDSGATWTSTNAGSNSSIGNHLDTVSMSYDTGYTLNPRHWYSFNITDAVQAWADGTANLNKGIIFKTSDEIEDGDTGRSRTLGAYNRSEDKPSLVITYTNIDQTITDGLQNATDVSFGDVKTIITTTAGERQYFKLTPTISGKYVIMSGDYTGDPYVWFYNSNYSNTHVHDDIEGVSNRNFRLSVTLSAGETYYIGVGHYGTNIGAYSFIVLKEASITNGFYQPQNVNSDKYLDVCGPGEQIYVHQWIYHTGEQEKWLIQKQLDGYYTIRSQYGNNKYIGISSTNIGENNIRLFDDITDNTRWNLYVAGGGTYVFEPITALGKAMFAPDQSTATKIQLTWASTNGNKVKWKLNSYSYGGLTFSAFDVGDSTQNEVTIVEEWMTEFGYTNIGSYNNADKLVLAETIKDIGRYSDVVYINGHGGRYANMKIQYGPTEDLDGDGEPDDGSNVISYLCADETVNPGDDVLRVGIGAEWKQGSTNITQSYWNVRTKWGILAQCAQLDFGPSIGAGNHWNNGTMSSAEVWARTMLGYGARIHGYVGYYDYAPDASAHIIRLDNFFNYCANNNMPIVDAWAFAHTYLVGSSNWAALYHSVNYDDRFQSMADCTASGSEYEIYYIARDISETALDLKKSENTSVISAASASIKNSNIYPKFVDTRSTTSDNTASSYQALGAVYSRLQESLSLTENCSLSIEENGRVIYLSDNRNWNAESFSYELTNDQAIQIAERQLNELGLLPKGEYRASVSRIQRVRLNLNNEFNETPETVEYTISFYQTLNGIDVVSDEEDGIIVSFNRNGLTQLSYLWRNMELITCDLRLGNAYITYEQAQAIYQSEINSAKSVITTRVSSDLNNNNCSVAYLQMCGETRPVYVFSSNDGYSNCIIVDMYSGEVLNIGA